jgi:hypothetical protein
MAKTEIVEQRLYDYNEPASMGVVKDTRYIRCHWPKLDQPTALFAEGSSGIEVEGPPTPRNVVFPPDTVFLNGTRGDCAFIRHKELISAIEQKPRYAEYIAELTAKEAREICDGKTDVTVLKASKDFVSIKDSPDKPETRRFSLVDGAIVLKGGR